MVMTCHLGQTLLLFRRNGSWVAQRHRARGVPNGGAVQHLDEATHNCSHKEQDLILISTPKK
jgi:hypothetical protein